MLAGPAPTGSLLREGAAMLRAVVEDFARLPGCEVATTWDARLEGPPARGAVHAVRSATEERRLFAALAASADGVLVIAPESDGALLDRVRQVEAAGGRLLSPGAALVAVAGDKHETGRRLQAAGVPTPFAVTLAADDPLPDDFPYPAVLKPRDGCGSQGVYWIDRCGDGAPNWPDGDTRGASDPHCSGWRLEQFCAGMAASVAVVCGPAGSVTLPAGRQHLSDDGRFRYLGGSLPLPPPLCARAAALAGRALDALPAAVGYVGVDLVLGAADDGSQDVVIEVNPRLTTSYLGLRAALEFNLARLMLQTAHSRVSVAFGR